MRHDFEDISGKKAIPNGFADAKIGIIIKLNKQGNSPT